MRRSGLYAEKSIIDSIHSMMGHPYDDYPTHCTLVLVNAENAGRFELYAIGSRVLGCEYVADWVLRGRLTPIAVVFHFDVGESI